MKEVRMNARSPIAATAALLVTILGFCGTVTAAGNYPSQPINIIVPYSPGGSTDLLARVVGKRLTEKLHQPVIVQNRPGANGIVGAQVIAKAAPDGYTIGIASPGTHAANASLYAHLPYDTIKDFTPLTQAVSAPFVLVVNPALGVHSVKELIAKAKASPGSISYASGGTGSSQHLAMEQFCMMAGIKMTHVPYNGSAASYTDLVGGQVMVEFDALPSALPFVKAGKLLAIAVATPKRLPELPKVPTVSEAGVRGYESGSWYGFVGPANLPKDVVATLSGAMHEALQNSDVRSTLTGAGLVVVDSSPQQFADFIKAQMKKTAAIIKAANIKPEG
jgi:tripartite-type tricarboxylate transporter receptor subunit TctC